MIAKNLKVKLQFTFENTHINIIVPYYKCKHIIALCVFTLLLAFVLYNSK